jgi:hypothetical protein
MEKKYLRRLIRCRGHQTGTAERRGEKRGEDSEADACEVHVSRARELRAVAYGATSR